jgi:MSHA biogenesis protein MshP
MFPKQFNSTSIELRQRSKQKGIGLPATVFLIVIVALIVLALGDLNTKSNIGFGQDFYSIKAFYAAESGAQIALNRVFVGGQACNNSLANIDFDTVTDNEGLESCQVDLTCQQVTVDVIDYLTFTSTAMCGAGLERATRAIQVRAHE